MFRTFLAGALMALAAAGANAAEVEVKMLNKGAAGAMVFEPALVKIAPGDTVKFVPTDKSHNAETVPEMLPAGAEPFVGKLNEQVEVTFKQNGVYGIKCKPHYGMGMVALIVVGEPANLEAAAAAKHPGKAKQVFADLVAKAK
ncbi:MAG: pseudoazurin [Bosea sp.]|uniref:pseudoazurin n=1 Tax=Bosea sp. (in: a-proteobacteria) TaxID=1871050 RepID=UPI001ACC6E6F|nr:pseudoazurin [Bosea sp. (in: a-proteobacteria)]MBN9453553.1 pseudoazurin [Bosea sp. (in: a-proteobacteria)]